MDANKPLTNHLPDEEVLFSLDGFHFDQLLFYIIVSGRLKNLPQKSPAILLQLPGVYMPPGKKKFSNTNQLLL
jgi:hypothetical protein